MKRRVFSQEEKQRLRSLREELKSQLREIPGFLDVGIGFKRVQGEMTDEIALRVYVKEKIS